MFSSFFWRTELKTNEHFIAQVSTKVFIHKGPNWKQTRTFYCTTWHDKYMKKQKWVKHSPQSRQSFTQAQHYEIEILSFHLAYQLSTIIRDETFLFFFFERWLKINNDIKKNYKKRLKINKRIVLSKLAWHVNDQNKFIIFNKF